MSENKIGSHFNLRVDVNYFDIGFRLDREKDLKKRIRILDEMEVSSMSILEINELLKSFCGDKLEIMNYLMKCNKDIFIQSMDPDLEYGYIHEYIERMEAQEDYKVRRDMVITLSDMYECKLIFLKDTNMLNDQARLHCINHSDFTSELYQDLLSIFKYDKKTIDTLNKIYPDLLENLDDKDLGSKVIVNMLSETIKMELDFKTMITIFKNTALTLAADNDWSMEDMSFLASEANYYIKRSIYSLTSADDLLQCLVYLGNEIEGSQTEKEYVILSGFMTYIDDIIEEALGCQYKNKHSSSYSMIPLDELHTLIKVLNSRTTYPLSDELDHPGLIMEIELVSEILLYYNEINEGSDILSKLLSEVNSDFISYLNKTIHDILDTNMTNTVKLLKWYEKMITDNALDLKATLLGICRLVSEGLEFYKRETIKSINAHTSYKIISFNPSGFTTDTGVIDMYDYNDSKAKHITQLIGNAQKMVDGMFSTNPASIKLMKSLYGVADVVGSSYNNNEVKDFLQNRLFAKNDRKTFDAQFFELVFGTHPNIDTSFENLFSLENVNSVLEIPVLRHMDMGMLWIGYKMSIAVKDVEIKSVKDEKLTFELDDVDLDYNFDDLLTDDSVMIWNLTPFQVLRQMKYDKLNLLSTSIYNEFPTYMVMYSLLKTYVN